MSIKILKKSQKKERNKTKIQKKEKKCKIKNCRKWREKKLGKNKNVEKKARK